jgi:hypothetical protein
MNLTAVLQILFLVLQIMNALGLNNSLGLKILAIPKHFENLSPWS